jgi:hypothetical protein
VEGAEHRRRCGPVVEAVVQLHDQHRQAEDVEARMNSWRLSSDIGPVRVSHWMAAIHSSSVSRTSRAKS